MTHTRLFYDGWYEGHHDALSEFFAGAKTRLTAAVVLYFILKIYAPLQNWVYCAENSQDTAVLERYTGNNSSFRVWKRIIIPFYKALVEW